ncbi:MAG: SHOCT domain-containing protein [Bacillota bacterium]
MMDYGMMHSGMMLFMFLWWAILIAGVVLAGYGIAHLIKNKDNKNGSAAPIEQLKLRYASGEISKEEYQEKRQFLQSQP